MVDDLGTPVASSVHLVGRYDDCLGGSGDLTLASTLVFGGVWSLSQPLPPAPGCGWLGLSIRMVLPLGSVYRPLSASAFAPGVPLSASEIRYPPASTGSYPGNDFVVELIPVDLTLAVDYPYLILRGPELPPPAGPRPAQTMRGQYTGPLPLSGRTITIHIWDGSWWYTYVTTTNAAGQFALTPIAAGDPLLGTILLGAWQAYAEVTIPASGTFVSPDAFWRVNWFPVHGTR